MIDKDDNNEAQPNTLNAPVLENSNNTGMIHTYNLGATDENSTLISRLKNETPPKNIIFKRGVLTPPPDLQGFF